MNVIFIVHCYGGGGGGGGELNYSHSTEMWLS